MKRCLICLRVHDAALDHHPDCARWLFGTPKPPAIDIDLARMTTFALAMTGRTSLSGVQQKLSLGFTPDRLRLTVASDRGLFVLKPQQGTFAALPENEHVTMRIADEVGIETARCGLVRLRDGTLAYLAKRFDRVDAGGKRRQEDFCQLAGYMPGAKYDGSAELCAKLVRTFATEPLIELRKLFFRLVFAWWTGNGDMHLKNFSLLSPHKSLHQLSPAYDLLSTALVIKGDAQALPVGGKRDRLRRKHWHAYANHIGLPEKAATSVLEALTSKRKAACDLVDASLLPEEMKATYKALLTHRAAQLND